MQLLFKSSLLSTLKTKRKPKKTLNSPAPIAAVSVNLRIDFGHGCGVLR